jgi:hypothetical protein
VSVFLIKLFINAVFNLKFLAFVSRASFPLIYPASNQAPRCCNAADSLTHTLRGKSLVMLPCRKVAPVLPAHHSLKDNLYIGVLYKILWLLMVVTNDCKDAPLCFMENLNYSDLKCPTDFIIVWTLCFMDFSLIVIYTFCTSLNGF